MLEEQCVVAERTGGLAARGDQCPGQIGRVVDAVLGGAALFLLAVTLAKQAGRKPREIAELLVAAINDPRIEKIEIATTAPIEPTMPVLLITMRLAALAIQ